MALNLVSSFTDFNAFSVGDYVWCKYIAPNGSVGVLVDFGTKTDGEVSGLEISTTSPLDTADGYFKFICVGTDWKGRKLFVADRVIQRSITYHEVNLYGHALGTLVDLIANVNDRTDNLTTYVTVTPTASCSYIHGPEKAFDNDYSSNNRWLSCSYPGVWWIQAKLDKPRVLHSYRLNLTQGSTGDQAPSWILYGSNDGSNWTTLDTQTTKNTAMININSWTPYLYYRVGEFSDTQQYITICEIELYEREITYSDYSDYNFYTRLMTGGISALDLDNEWDKFLVESTLNGNITAGDNAVWNAGSYYSWTSSAIAWNQIAYRGYNTDISARSSNVTTADAGYRPIFVVEKLALEYRKYLLQDDSGIYNIASEALNLVGSAPATQTMFNDYAFFNLADITSSIVQSLGANKKLLINYYTAPPNITINKIGGKIRYLASFDSGTTWKAYTGGTWSTISALNISNQGMTTDELNAITSVQWGEIYSDGDIKFLAELYSYESTVTPTVDNIAITLPVAPGRTVLKYAFSRDGRASWRVWDGSNWVLMGALSQLASNGMTKAEVEAITTEEWKPMIWESNTYSLDVAISLTSNDPAQSPILDSIAITYNKIPASRVGDDISLPTPADNLHRYVYNDTTQVYELKYVEGLLFHDGVNDYYTTQKGLILKYLELPLMYAGTESIPVSAVLENTFDIEATDITLTADVTSMPINSAIKFSTVETPFEDADSLAIPSLAAGGEYTFWVKLTTQADSFGNGQFDIRVNGTVPFIPV